MNNSFFGVKTALNEDTVCRVFILQALYVDMETAMTTRITS